MRGWLFNKLFNKLLLLIILQFAKLFANIYFKVYNYPDCGVGGIFNMLGFFIIMLGHYKVTILYPFQIGGNELFKK